MIDIRPELRPRWALDLVNNSGILIRFVNFLNSCSVECSISQILIPWELLVFNHDQICIGISKRTTILLDGRRAGDQILMFFVWNLADPNSSSVDFVEFENLLRVLVDNENLCTQIASLGTDELESLDGVRFRSSKVGVKILQKSFDLGSSSMNLS